MPNLPRSHRVLIVAWLVLLLATGVVSQVVNGPYTVLPTLQLQQNGTAGAPSYSWTIDPTTGFYRFGSGQIGMSGHLIPSADATYDIGTATQRVRNLYLSGSLGGITTSFADGSAGAPSITFTNQTTVGFFRPSTGTIGVAGNLQVNPILTPNGVSQFENSTGAAGIRFQFNGLPTITGSSFGTGNSVTAGSTDTEGEINVGTTPKVTGVLVFNATWASNPRCVGQISTTVAVNVRLVTAVETTTQVTFAFFNPSYIPQGPANNALLHYICLGTR